MRGWLGAALLALLSIAAAGPATAVDCGPSPGLPPPAVRLQTLEPRLVYRHDVDLRGLSQIRTNVERAPKGWMILGLTHPVAEIQLSMKWRSRPLPDGRQCIWLTQVDGQLGDQRMDVYVASNYPVGSCEYNVVLAHENEHVAINRSVMASYRGRVEAALRDAAVRHSPLVLRGSEPVKDAVYRDLSAAAAPLLEQMRQELATRNGAIDTPESYRRISQRCRNWFPPGTTARNPG